MKLSNKKIKYIKRHFLKKSPADIAGDLRIPVKEVNQVLKQLHSIPSSDRSSTYLSGKTLDIPYKYHLISCFLLCLLCIIVYSNTLDSPFIFDDVPNIEFNSFVRLTEFDLKKVYEAAFKSPNPSLPLANLSFALNYYFWGNNVTAYHIVNIIIHLFNGILIYFIALILFRQVFSLRIKKHCNTPVPPSS